MLLVEQLASRRGLPSRIGIKRTENGYASNWLCDNAMTGMELTVLPPSGHFTAKNLDVDFLFFAGGSGITRSCR